MTTVAHHRTDTPNRVARKARPRSSSRWSLLWRIFAAIPLNYAFTSLGTAFAARYLPLDPGQASVAATLASFLLFAVIVLMAFSIRAIGRLWLFMVVSGGLMAFLIWLSILAEGRG